MAHLTLFSPAMLEALASVLSVVAPQVLNNLYEVQARKSCYPSEFRTTLLFSRLRLTESPTVLKAML